MAYDDKRLGIWRSCRWYRKPRDNPNTINQRGVGITQARMLLRRLNRRAATQEAINACRLAEISKPAILER